MVTGAGEDISILVKTRETLYGSLTITATAEALATVQQEHQGMPMTTDTSKSYTYIKTGLGKLLGHIDHIGSYSLVHLWQRQSPTDSLQYKSNLLLL